MTTDPVIVTARAREAAAKARFEASLSRVKARLSPRSLATDAVETARDRAVEAAQTGLQAARDRPATTAALIGAIGLAVAHRPLLGWASALFRRTDATRADDAS